LQEIQIIEEEKKRRIAEIKLLREEKRKVHKITTQKQDLEERYFPYTSLTYFSKN
jgi:hypothetical protein